MIMVMIMIFHMILENIWLVVEPHPSEKYDIVSWDDDYNKYMDKIWNIYGKIIQNVPNHQPALGE